MSKFVLKGVVALIFGLAAAYSAYAAINSTASEHCILAASFGFLFLTLALAFLPGLNTESTTRQSKAGQRVTGLS